MTKIAFIVEDFPPANPGGIAVWAYHICKNLSKKSDIDLTVFLKKRKWQYSDDWFADTQFNIRPMLGRNWKKFRYYFVYFPLKKYLKQNPNAIVFSSNWELSEPILKLQNKYSTRLFTAIHGLEVTQHLDNKKYLNRISKVLNNSDLLFPVSDFTKRETLKIKNIDNSKFKTITIGGAPDQYYPDKSCKEEIFKKYNLYRDAKVILTLARVIERKGHDLVIKSLPQIIKQIPNVYYIISGNIQQSWKDKLDMIIEELNIKERVIFTGLVDEKEKFMLYNASDVYVMVSRYDPIKKDSEGFGITFIEANLSGLPVIGSRCGGIPDAIEHNISGLLVEEENIEQTSDAISKILTSKKLYKRLSENGRKRALENFTWEKVADKYYNEIKNIIEK